MSMKDLRRVGVDFLTIGQYLRPTRKHLSVQTYVSIKTFEKYKRVGEALGFKYVISGPLVRGSYKAGEFFIESLLRDNDSR